MNFANPVLVFATVWGTVLILHSLRLLWVLEPMNNTTLALVLTNMLIFALLYFLVKKIQSSYLQKPRSINKTIETELLLLKQYTDKLFYCWIIGTIVNIGYSGGIPLYWMLTGSENDYRNYGIPTFGGFVAAINAFLAASYFILYYKNKEKRTLLMLVLQLLWPVLAVSRGNFTYILFEILGTYLLISKSNIRTIFFTALTLFSFLYIFGLMGDFRLGAEKALAFKRGVLNQDYIEMAEYLPSGILYAYMYITTPINNIVFNIENLNPNYIPYYSTVFLFPTILRSLIFEGGDYPLEMISDVFNTFTFYAGYLKDFGVYVTVVLVSIIQFGTIILYLKALRGKLSSIIAYAVAFQCIVLSVFNDNFTMHMSVFQIVLALYFGRYCKVRYSSIKRPYEMIIKTPIST